MRILRQTTIEKLIDYLGKAKSDQSLVKLSEKELSAISDYDGSKLQTKQLSKLLHSRLSEEEVDRLISRMTSFLDREKFSKTNITIRGDTKQLINRKMRTLEYDSIDELLNDALAEFQR